MRVSGPTVIILISAIFAGFTARASWQAQQQVIHEAEERSLAGVAEIVRHITETEARRTTALAEVFAARETIQAQLRAGDREGLQKDNAAVYQRLKASFGVEGIQYDVPPGRVFLRMHEPEKFGDDVTGRQMVTLAMQGGESQGGIEVGRSGAKVRGVVQVRDGAGPVGVVEVMAGFEPLLTDAKAMTGYEFSAYLRQVGEPPEGSRMRDGYRELATTDRETVLAALSSQSLDGVNDALFDRVSVEGRRFGLVRAPLMDFGGSNIGVIVATRSLADLQSREAAALRGALVTAVVQVVAVAGAALLMFNGKVLRPVRRLTEALSAGEAPAEDLLSRSDDIGALAQAIQASQAADPGGSASKPEGEPKAKPDPKAAA